MSKSDGYSWLNTAPQSQQTWGTIPSCPTICVPEHRKEPDSSTENTQSHFMSDHWIEGVVLRRNDLGAKKCLLVTPENNIL